MASPQIEKIGEFVPSKEDWTQYIERLNNFFVTNDIDAADNKHAVLLTVIGPTANPYHLLYSSWQMYLFLLCHQNEHSGINASSINCSSPSYCTSYTHF